MAPKKHVILFLAANPSDTDRLSLDREARAIQLELKRSGYRDRFEFVTWWAAEPLDLLRELRERPPTIVHFSGHGASADASQRTRNFGGNPTKAAHEPGGVTFQREDGSAQVVTAEAFARALKASGASVRLVVLNACFTAPAAALLATHVDCVVGMSGAIHDDAARIFSTGFYGGLGEQASVAAAFAHGVAAIDLEGLPGIERPQLVVRDGFDAEQLVLAAAEPMLVVERLCPYPGMRPFSAEDSSHFHGRTREIAELIGRLRLGEREIFVIGPSGSGKSSLVTAGVLPRLARGEPGLGLYVVRELRPGESPAKRLAEALEAREGPLLVSERVAALLAHHAAGAQLLVLVDQLEELFTLATAGQRAAFLSALRELRAEPRCVVVFTLRADFFGALMESDLWAERHGRLSRLEVSPLRGDELAEAIVDPASAMGVTVEPDLVVRLVADAASEPGVLPLLQETMVQLWAARSDQTLTLAGYEALGDEERNGLSVALTRRADATMRRFDDDQAGVARRILLRLVHFGEGRADTRRQQSRAQLRSVGDDQAACEFVLQAMVEDRLLTVDDDATGEPRVDLSHEAIIAAWPELQQWLRERRDDEQRRRRLEAKAGEWIERGSGDASLLDVVELAEAERWRASTSAHDLGEPPQLAELVAASKRAIDERVRRRRQGTRRTISALAVGLAMVSTLAIVAWLQRESARESSAEAQRQTNVAKEKSAEAQQQTREVHRKLADLYQEQGRALLIDQSPSQPVRALPYLSAARDEQEQAGDAVDPTLRMLFARALKSAPRVLVGHEGDVVAAVFSPDGTRVLTASRDQTARVWDARSGKPLTAPLVNKGIVTAAAFSPDGTRVVIASGDHAARVWDAGTGWPVTELLVHQDIVIAAAFSPDGTRVVTASGDKTARVWDARSGRPLTEPLVHRGAVCAAAFSPDGTRVVTASWDWTARVWDARSGQPVAAPLVHQRVVRTAEFSPDGTRVVTASLDKTARVWDARSGQPATEPLMHQDEVFAAAFSPDGTRVVTASLDGTARVWDARSGQPVTEPLVHQGWVRAAAFSPDGTRVVTASLDGTARVWDARSGQPVTEPFAHQGDVTAAVFSPDSTRVVTASGDQTARVWDARSGLPVTEPLVHRDSVTSAEFSPDGTRVVTASVDRTARVWDARSGKAVTEPLVHQGTVRAAVFSRDGTRVVTASLDETARVWDARSGRPVTEPLVHQGDVTAAVFSPDGTRVVTASDDKTARVWDVRSGQLVTEPLVHQGAVCAAVFSQDGTRVVTASLDGTARVWDARSGRPLIEPFVHKSAVCAAEFSPDGTQVVTASWDKTARVWDARNGQPVTEPLVHREAVLAAEFSPDGTRVVTASLDRTARVWDARSGRPVTAPLVHRDHITSAVFSPDGTRVVTASWDKTARVWDARSGRPLTEPLVHRGRVTAAVFSPDGARVVTASEDRTARVWELPLDNRSAEVWKRCARCAVFTPGDGGPNYSSCPAAD